jgi:tRNA A-37 threonylcarbamoyl transferase component Bud32
VERGQRIADRFVVQRPAGEGGMADVYQALDERSGQRVALKVLRARRPDHDDLARFLREAAVLAELRHPSIVGYVTHGDADGRSFLALEWVEGDVLSRRLTEGRLTREEGLALGAAVAEALGEAHRHGVVHRDVKPSNIMLVGGDARAVKLLDFGVAHLCDSGEALTQDGAMLGTAGYMAPEQARGEPVDARTDVFALGCVLFRCLTGQPIFKGGDGLSLLLKLVLERPPRLRELWPEAPRALDDLLGRMLAPAAADRPADGAAVAAALAAVGTTSPSAVTGETRSAARPPEGSLTSRERRVTCVILARAAAPVGEAQLRAVIAPFDAHAEVLAGGAIAVTVGAFGAAIDQAARAARCALHLRPLLGEAPMALVAGWGDGPAAIEEAVDRGVPLLADQAGGERHALVRLDEVAAGLLGTRFDVAGDEGGLHLRGERDVAAPERMLLGKPTPCVGRDRELRMLETIFDDGAGEPAARAALITGETGVGKSRLRHELLRRLEARGQPLEIWIGHGDPMGAGSPFGMIAPALRRAAGIAPGEPLAVRRRKLRARVGRRVAPAELQRVAEFLGELAGVPFDDAESVPLRAARGDAQLMGDQMRRAFEDLLAAECAAQPVLIVLEDLHWGDLPSVRFIDAALRNLADRPLLVLALARPEVRQVFPELWAARAPTEIKLGGLLARWSDGLVRSTLGDRVDDVTAARLVELSAGNAFYLEELIRAVAAGRTGELPETVVAMVQAVLAGLDPEARRMLRAASVLGGSFGASGVAALAGAPLGEVEGWLRVLVEREVLVRRARGAAAGDGEEDEHRFRHAHVREAAYATLTDADRALGHRLAGAWLEQTADRDAARLAEHFERGGELERAVRWYRVAAEQALEANDLAGAVERAERGVECGAEGEAFGALRLSAAEAHGWQGRSREAMLCAIDAARELPRGRGAWLVAISVIASSAMNLGDEETLLRAADELDEAHGAPDDVESRRLPAAHLLACARVAGPLFLLGKGERAERLLARADGPEGRAAIQEPAVRARVLETRALAALCAGLSGDFLALAGAAATAFAGFGDLRNAAVQGANVGSVLVSLGALAEAERELGEVLATAARLGLAQIAAAARQNLALALSRQGRRAEAHALASESVAEAVAQGNTRLAIGARILLALVTGDPDEAAREAQAAADLVTGPAPQRAYALGALTRARLARGQAAGALEAAREAMAVLDAVGGMDEGEALVRLAHAEACLAVGDAEAARRAITDAALRLEERAGRITDGPLRRSFLEQVPEHRRTLALARSLSPR